MSDEQLRLVASVEDKFTGPLGKLKRGVQEISDETKHHVGAMSQDWDRVRGGVSKFEGVLRGVTPVLSGLGVAGIGVGLSVAGMATALGDFSSKTRNLSLMAKDIGLTIDQLRTFEALGERFGVTADTMAGAAKSFAGQMFEIKRHGEAYVQLQAMNLGKLAEELAGSKSMREAIERGMEGLRNIPDAEVRRRVSRMLFGTDDIGLVAQNLTGSVKDSLKGVSDSIGQMSKETEQAAKDFQRHMSRISEAAERAKLKFVGPLLRGLSSAIDDVDNAANNPEAAKLKMLKDSRESADKAAKSAPWPLKGYMERQRDSLDAEIKKLEEATRKGTEKGVRDALRDKQQQTGEATVQQQSFSGTIPGNGSLIQKAAWSGFGGRAGGAGGGFGGPGPLGGSAGTSSLGSGSEGAAVYGGPRGNAGTSPSAPVPNGQQIDRTMPDLGDGSHGRPFGSKGPIVGRGGVLGGKKGPVGIPYEANDLKGALGINDAQWGAYREGLTDIEGKRYEQVGGAGGLYSGRYQFGPNEIAQTARQLGEVPPTRAQFLRDKAMQERFMERYTLEHHRFLERNSAAYRDMSPEKKLEILGYAHNQGAGRGRGRTVGALGYLESGRVGHDGFGTAGTRYFETIRKRLAEVQGNGTGPVAGAGALSAPTGPLSQPKAEAPDADGAPEATDGRGVNADLIKVVKRAQELSKVSFHIHEGLRTLERQRDMVRRGWSKTLDSEHIKGRAIDVRADGDPAVGDLNRKKYEEINRAMRQASEEAGIPVEWGGDWKTFKDLPHFQFPKGYRARPNVYAGDPAPSLASKAGPLTKPRAMSDDPRVGPDEGFKVIKPWTKVEPPKPEEAPGAEKRQPAEALRDRIHRVNYAPTVGGKGSLHIKLEGFPAGTKTKATMDDLFKDTTVTRSRSQMDMA